MTDSTARLTDHARERCAEMGISTKVVKRIVQNATLRMPAREGPRGEPRTMIRSTTHFPEVVVVMDDATQQVVTAMWWSPEQYHPRADGRPARAGDPTSGKGEGSPSTV